MCQAPIDPLLGARFRIRLIGEINFENIVCKTWRYILARCGFIALKDNPHGITVIDQLLKCELKPVLIERGKNVKAQRHIVQRCFGLDLLASPNQTLAAGKAE